MNGARATKDENRVEREGVKRIASYASRVTRHVLRIT